MPLARITNYVDGNVLTGAQLNNEFDNILNNPVALVSAARPSISKVQGLTGSLVSNIGSFAANGYEMKTTTVLATVTATSSYSINTRTVGPIANGRDQAAAFASTTIHFYAISTGGTSTSAVGICSSVAPPTGPTLPAGYTGWTYLASAIYSPTTSETLISAIVMGARTYYDNAQTVGTFLTSVGSPTSGYAKVPRTAAHMHMTVAPTGVFASTGGPLDISATLSALAGGLGTNITINPIIYNASTAAGGAYQGAPIPFTLPNLETTPMVYYTGAVNTGTSGRFPVLVTGFSVPNGDVG